MAYGALALERRSGPDHDGRMSTMSSHGVGGIRGRDRPGKVVVPFRMDRVRRNVRQPHDAASKTLRVHNRFRHEHALACSGAGVLVR